MLSALGKPRAFLKVSFPEGAVLQLDAPNSSLPLKSLVPCSLPHLCSPALSYSSSLVNPHSWSLLSLLNSQKLFSSAYFSLILLDWHSLFHWDHNCCPKHPGEHRLWNDENAYLYSLCICSFWKKYLLAFNSQIIFRTETYLSRFITWFTNVS